VILLEASGITNEPKVMGRFRLIEDHPGTFDHTSLKDLADRPASVDTKMGIEIRGRSSQSRPKKAYSIELRDDAGASRAIGLLGMPKESDWVLYACTYDRSCLRNALAYTLAREMNGGWHPRFQFVEVYLNGQYNGLYNLVERIKRDKSRVDLPEPAESKALGDVSGGYIVRIEFNGKEPKAQRTFKPAGADREYVYSFPRYTDIKADHRDYLNKFLSDLETMMRGASFADAATGYPKWLEVGSWVDHTLMREFARDIDAYRLSTYLFKRADADGGKFHAGPVWDFDRTFGNATYYDADKTEGWSTEDARRANTAMPLGKYEYPPPWWTKLLRHGPFREKMGCRWKSLRESGERPFATDKINAKLDAWVTHVTAAQKRDDARWKNIGSMIDTTIPPRGATWAEEVAFLKRWVRDRAAWLDRTISPLCK
jgi:hypothetical protein